MKKLSTLLVAALFALASGAPAFATVAKKPAARAHSVIGEVVSANASDNSFIVREGLKSKSTEEITLYSEPSTKFLKARKKVDFAALTAGETVKVAYTTAADGKNVATSVSILKAARTKKAMKPAEKAATPANTEAPAKPAAPVTTKQ